MPTKIKTNPETPLVFQPSGTPFPSGVGFPSGVIVNFAVDGMASGVGHISNRYDFGPGPRTTLFEWRGNAILSSGTPIGATVDTYISTDNSVFKDGKLPTVDSVVSSFDKRRNLMFCGSLTCDSPGGVSGVPDPAISAGIVEIFARYISVVWFNNTNYPLGTGNCFILTPIPDEIEN